MSALRSAVVVYRAGNLPHSTFMNGKYLSANSGRTVMLPLNRPVENRVLGVMDWSSNAVRWRRSSVIPAVLCVQTFTAPTHLGGGCVTPVLSKPVGN